MFAGVVMVVLAAASWGAWSLFLRPAGLPETVSSPLMFATMAVVTLPFALRAPAVRWARRDVVGLVVHGAFDALNVLAFFGALRHTTVAVAVLTHYLAPILIALAAPVFERTRVRGAIPAAAVALVGLLIVLAPWRDPAPGAGVVSWLGPLLGLVSAVCYAGNVFVIRRLAARIGAPRVMAYHSLIAAALLAPLAASADLGAVSLASVGLVVAGAVTLGALSGVVFAVGLVRTGAARAAVLTFAEPLVAVAVGALVWDEPLHAAAWLGGALVLAAGIHVARQANPGAPAATLGEP